MAFCGWCGREIQQGATRCPYCGQRQPPDVQPSAYAATQPPGPPAGSGQGIPPGRSPMRRPLLVFSAGAGAIVVLLVAIAMIVLAVRPAPVGPAQAAGSPSGTAIAGAIGETPTGTAALPTEEIAEAATETPEPTATSEGEDLLGGLATAIGTALPDIFSQNTPTPAPAPQEQGTATEGPLPTAQAADLEEKGVFLRIGGTPGLPFKGAYVTGGKKTTLEGQVPLTFKVDQPRLSVTATVENQEASGTLSVELIVDYEVWDAQSTAEPYGVVTVEATISDVSSAPNAHGRGM